MGTMSDSQYEYEFIYDEDFDDDVSADDNNQIDDHDSGMEEKVRGRNSYDTDTDFEISKTGLNSSSLAPLKHTKNSNGKAGGRDQRNTLDPYKTSIPTTSRRAQSDPRGRKPNKPSGGNNNKGTSSRSTVNPGPNGTVMMKRVLSANKKKSTSLHNVIYELEQQCEALRIENKDLRRNVRIQDRDLRKLDGAEAQLPMVMKRHNNEINLLQDKWKKQKEVSTNLTENIKRADMELLKTKDKLKEYQTMAKEKNLGERIVLKNKILDLEYDITEKDSKISELTRSIMLQKKTHSRIVKEKNEKYDKTVRKVKALEEVQNDLELRIKDREKALDVNNIYSRRKQKEEKQIVLSPLEPIAQINYLGEGFQEIPPKLLLFSENNEEEPCSAKSSVRDRVDTMVNRNDKLITYEQEIPREHAEELGTTFLTEAKLRTKKVSEESEDFYNIDRKENSSTLSTTDTNSLEEEEVHGDMSNEEVIVEVVSTRAKLKPLRRQYGQQQQQQQVEKTMEHVKVNNEVLRRQYGQQQQQQVEKTTEHVKVNNEVDETAKARKLLLAKLQAIDNGENPRDINETSLNLRDKMNEKKSKQNKKPIFLMSDNKTETKSFDSSPDSDSKPNSGNSKPHRVRPSLDSYSGTEDDFSTKTRERKDSWEFRKTDENLHKGLPSHIDSQSSPQANTFSGNKNRTRSKFGNDDNPPSRYDPSYSPTVFTTNTGLERKTKNNDEFNLFDQFEDPFKNAIQSSKQGMGNQPAGSKKEPAELSSRKKKSSRTPDPVVIDDLEEMFIL